MRGSEARQHFRRYYHFHRDHDHDIEECFQLRDEIKALIHRGILNRFVQNWHDEGAPVENAAPPEDQNNSRPIAGTINAIEGGPAEESSTKEPARKEALLKHQRTTEAISFSDEDLKGVETPHDDVVVISLIMNKFVVKRVLVDNRSSANVLFYDTFQKIGMTEDQLRRMNVLVVGFTENLVPVKGVVSLPITVELAPRESTVKMDILVVRMASVYNVILSRPGFNAFWAIVSIYHLLMRFPTKRGVGEVQGDQAMLCGDPQSKTTG
ncbi:uncharacterized protein LOC120109988 [Phoenix dactylifera]|uniref:Uncharacterized protein LOC120109988 n=1 Tax=Phoenix dactylifera TaxID=42345 RepID=A0A8B9A2J2_PHODC|nr:uncharacterized protein LOC120109988 [Phoenix dactylifera]